MAKPQKQLPAQDHALQDAVRSIQAEWQTATRALVRIGQVVLDTCFEGNARLLLEEGAARTVRYAELVRRVGALGIGLGEKTLNVGVRIAAYDQLVRGNHWKLLDPGRKEDLLPLREPPLLAAGARFAVEMGSSRENLRKWVASQRTQGGQAPRLRGMGLKGTRASVLRLARLQDEKTLQRVEQEFERAGAVERRRALEEIRAAHAGLLELERRLKR